MKEMSDQSDSDSDSSETGICMGENDDMNDLTTDKISINDDEMFNYENCEVYITLRSEINAGIKLARLKLTRDLINTNWENDRNQAVLFNADSQI